MIQCALGFCHPARIQRKQHDFNFTWQSVKREKGHNSCFKQFRIIEPNLRGWPSAFSWEPTQNQKKRKKERHTLKSIMVDKNTERNWRLIQKTVFNNKKKSTRSSNYLVRWVYRWYKYSPDSDCHGKKETRDIFISDGIKRSEVISGEVQTTLYRLQRVI